MIFKTIKNIAKSDVAFLVFKKKKLETIYEME